MWSFFNRDLNKEFPYEISDRSEFGDIISVWNLFKAKKKGTNECVSVFSFDAKNRTDNEIEIAKQSLKGLKTLRHPTILTYLDSYETDKNIHLVTEYVEPLDYYLKNINWSPSQNNLMLMWGIYQITKAISFLNNDAKLQHNNINIWSIFVNKSGEWKLGGLEYLYQHSDRVKTIVKVHSQLQVYAPPEGYSNSQNVSADKCPVDIWGLGCLIWEVFNGRLSTKASLKNCGKIPAKLVATYRESISENPKKRPSSNLILENGRQMDSYFNNILINTIISLDEIQIVDKIERNLFFDNLTNNLDQFPDVLCKNKILPKLIYAYEYGEAGPNVLIPLFKISRTLNEIEFQKTVLPCLVKLFNSNDRATRSRLLSQLENFINYIPKQLLNDTIFPQISNGFFDSNLTIKEQTIKVIVCIAPKLNNNNLNTELLKYFAALLIKDDNGGIRTNVTVCLGKIAEYLDPKSRQKVLISAFIKAMRDPFPAARNAGVIAFCATQQYYLISEIAQRILPALSQLAIDPDKTVRDSVFRTIRVFLTKLEKCSDDPNLKDTLEAEVLSNKPNLSNAAAQWTGWAVNAVTSKFHRTTTSAVTSEVNKQSKVSEPAPCSVPKNDLKVVSQSNEIKSNSNNTEEELISWDDDDWGNIDFGSDSKNVSIQSKSLNTLENINLEGTDNDNWNVDW